MNLECKPEIHLYNCRATKTYWPWFLMGRALSKKHSSSVSACRVPRCVRLDTFTQILVVVCCTYQLQTVLFRGKAFRVRIAPRSLAGRDAEGTSVFLGRMMHEIQTYEVIIYSPHWLYFYLDNTGSKFVSYNCNVGTPTELSARKVSSSNRLLQYNSLEFSYFCNVASWIKMIKILRNRVILHLCKCLRWFQLG